MVSLCCLSVTWSLSMSPEDGSSKGKMGICLQTPYPILLKLYFGGTFYCSGLQGDDGNLLGNLLGILKIILCIRKHFMYLENLL